MKFKEKLKERAKNLYLEIPVIFIALKHPKTPFWAKILAGAAIFYALSPIDIIPDFIPFLGYLDDLILLPLLVAGTIKLIPADIMEECREKAKEMWKNGRPKKWYYALPIVLVWLLIIFFILKAVLK